MHGNLPFFVGIKVLCFSLSVLRLAIHKATIMAPKKGKEADMFSARTGLVNSFTRNKNFIFKNFASMTAAELEARLSLIESNYSQYCTVQARIEQESEDASDYDSRTEVEELYCEIKAKIVTCIAHTSRHSGGNESLVSVQVPRSAKLPNLKLPQFSGKFTEWTSWFNTFVLLIGSDIELDDLSKLIHLRSSLSPVPLSTIDCLELTGCNYGKALRLLQDRYENKSIIVQAHINELFNLKRLKQADSEALRIMVDTVNSQLVALKSISNEQEILDAIIFHLIRSKLDDETIDKWDGEWDCTKMPSWTTLSQFLIHRGMNLANREARRSNNSRATVNKNEPKRASLAATIDSNVSNTSLCYYCSGPHGLKACPKFKQLSEMQRYNEVKKLGLCFVCFSKRHSTRGCSAQHCSICSKPHHDLLHRANRDVVSNSHAAQESSSLHSSLLMGTSTNFLATAIVFVRNSKGNYDCCKCVLDSGSQLNFVTSRLVSELGLQMQDSRMCLSGIGNSTSQIVGEVQATIKSRVTRFSATPNFYVLPEITQYNPSCSALDVNGQIPQRITLADPTFNSAQSIDMLLGVSIFFKLIVAGQIKLGPNMPILQRSLFGWIVVGEFTPTTGVSLLVNEAKKGPSKPDELHDLVQRFWRFDELPEVADKFTSEERQCETHFASNVRQLESGRLVVALPFKEPKVSLGDTYKIALSRFLNLERKLCRQPALKQQYVDFIEEYASLGHLEIWEDSKIQEVQYFLPHHPVVRPDSLTTKLRVVFDASCKSSNGVSLNDTMLVGPTLQPELFETLTRFRFYKYALSADIAKMYRQILVTESQRNYQCILWRSNSADPIKVLRLKTVTYGTNSAPFLAVRCLYYLAEKFGEQFPLAAKAINKNFYMDDMLCGADSIAELLELKREATEILEQGGFELRKWRSNYEQISQPAEPLTLKTGDAAKTLGIYWTSGVDRFQFSYNIKYCSTITKRTVLSELAQVFDPLGFLSPILILGKIFVQELWLLKQDWDEELSSSYAIQWSKYREELKLIDQCSLPRSVVPVEAEVDTLELFGFSDASNRAYGGAVYSRLKDTAGQVTVRLVAAKSKVSPVRASSLPRLELQGAVIMTKLMAKVCSSIHLKVSQIAYFTDSTIVLNWLSAHASRWTTFVANRVAQIQELSNIQDWFKVDTKLNPADIVSRGLYPTDLHNSELWWHGPQFLKDVQDTWRSERWKNDEPMPEQRKTTFSLAASIGHNNHNDIVSTSKFVNDFLKLQRVFGFIFRWRKRTMKATTQKLSALTAAELSGGLRYIVFNLQNSMLREEFTKLRQRKQINSAKIQCLNPFISEEEGIPIIRVGGRLSKAELAFDTKHPILLLSNHPVINALVKHTHHLNLHAGVLALCAFLRQKYWIVNCRKLARKIVRGCVTCFRLRPVLATQLMGDLPTRRVSGNNYPFQRAGLDFAGPIWMHFNMRGKRPVKVYLCVFVCFLTKACHLEIVSDLSTNAFIAALKRFFARRGLSTDLYCDNATNFVGASRELNQGLEELDKCTVVDVCTKRGVQFHFIPPRSPHFGGLWESAVKVAKQLLVKSANSTSLNFEDLSTAVAQVEAVMNSRPLHPLSSDANDLEALTPGHFLVGRPLNALVESVDSDLVKLSMINHWKRILLVQSTFWKRWSSEYLTLLQERTRWTKGVSNIKLDSLALIAEDNSPPGQWLLGRVVELHPGADGVVRVVTLRTKSGTLKRNIHKICPLPLEEE